MSKKQVINEMVKDFPEEVCGEFRYWNLQRKYGYNKTRQLMGFEAIELNSEMTILVEYDTLLLYGVLTLENVYLVDFVDGQYVVVDEIDSVQWMDEKIELYRNEKIKILEERAKVKENEINEEKTNELYCFESETGDNVCVVGMDDWFLNLSSIKEIDDGSFKITLL